MCCIMCCSNSTCNVRTSCAQELPPALMWPLRSIQSSSNGVKWPLICQYLPLFRCDWRMCITLVLLIGRRQQELTCYIFCVLLLLLLIHVLLLYLTVVFRLYGFCLGQPGWAGTRRNIHPFTPIVVISCPLSASSIYYDAWHPPCSIHTPDNLFPQYPSFLWSTSWPGTLHFILHTFLHQIIVFFL